MEMVYSERRAGVTESPDRSFADGQPVDSIDTEKSRIVLHELESGWWILAVGIMRCPPELGL